MKRFLLLLALTIILLMVTAMAIAQDDDTCPVIVQEALDATDLACADTGRNEACYGNVSINAIPRDGVDDETFIFEQQGDVVPVATIQTLQLAPLDREMGTWGVALLRLQANIPDSLPGQNVTFLAFGDVEIESGSEGMDVFFFHSGVGDAACEEAPESGLLIQTPDGVGEVAFTMNGVDVTLGSTAFFQAEPDGFMGVYLFDGGATVSAEGETQVLPAGNALLVPMDADLRPAGPPTEPHEFEVEDFAALPLDRVTAFTGGDEQSVSGEVIVPLNGTWQSSLIDDIAIVGDGCPPGMSTVVIGPMVEQMTAEFGSGDAVFVDFGDPFDPTLVFAESGIPFEMTNPELNVYVFLFTDEGVSAEWYMTVVSETELTITSTISMGVPGGCDIIVPIGLERVGD